MKRTQHIAYFKVPYKQKDNDNYQNNDNFCCGDKKSSKDDGITDNEDPELNQFYYHSDHLGSSSYITNLKGSIVQHIEYVPFGEVFLEERNNKWNTPYLFNSKELDEETGLYYYGARYYNSRNSIFLSVDPLWEAKPSFSPYAYTMNNPLKFTDPTGMLEEDPPFSYLKPGQQNSEIKTIPNPILQNSYISKLPNISTNETEIKTLGNPPKGRESGEGLDQTSKNKLKIIQIYPEHTDSYDGFWGGVKHLWTGGNENGARYDWKGNYIGLSPIMGMPPSFIGGPLRKGQSALKVGKYLFNPTAFHSVKKGVLTFVNPKNFSHIVGKNPDLIFKGGKVWLTGTKTGGYYGKSYDTGVKIVDFLKLF